MREKMNIFGDSIGYVRLIDTMGDEYTPAEDARMSTGKGRLGPEKDGALQVRLSSDNHTSPSEGVIAKVEVCAPLSVIREADRHRTEDKVSEFDPFDNVSPEESLRKWFARNEMSGRYVQMPDLYYHPVEIRGQSRTNMQGDGQNLAPITTEVAEEFVRRGKELTRSARELYSWGVEQGIEKGMARFYNTQNQYTYIRYTGSLKNWLDALYLRRPKVVLWECRMVFESIFELLKESFPHPVSTWETMVYNGVRFTGPEADYLRKILNGELVKDDGGVGEKIFKKLGML